jgi:hypothetical protein
MKGYFHSCILECASQGVTSSLGFIAHFWTAPNGEAQARRELCTEPSIQSASHNQIEPRYKAAKRRRLQRVLGSALYLNSHFDVQDTRLRDALSQFDHQNRFLLGSQCRRKALREYLSA